jgi:hypothetical protein
LSIGVEFENPASNQDLIKEGDSIISQYLKEELRKSHPDDVVTVLSDYLTTVDMLSHVALHMGSKISS